MIKPLISEKSMAAAKGGKYTFWASWGLNKYQIKEAINKEYKVHVKTIRTLKKGGSDSKNYMGKKRVVAAKRKAVVTLGPKEKIDAFETKKGKKK